jgi:hypothetical protein
MAIVMTVSSRQVSMNVIFRDSSGRNRLHRVFSHSMGTGKQKGLTAIPLTP